MDPPPPWRRRPRRSRRSWGRRRRAWIRAGSRRARPSRPPSSSSSARGSGASLVRGAFSSAFVILLREGLEALLVLAALIAVLVKSGRRDALPWVHAGWIAALLL